jgi:hypothetical protein
MIQEYSSHGDSDSDLEKLKTAFPFDENAKPLEGKLSLAQIRELLTSLDGTKKPPEPVAGGWYAVLFLSESKSPECKHCAAFDRELTALEQKAAGKLVSVRVTTY